VVGLKNERIIVRIPRSASTELLVITGNYWNVDVLDIRWYENGRPTRKGVRMNLVEANTVRQAIERALQGVQYDNINTNDEESIEENGN
tara:strand:- start:78 stop:344 length:267 start_codon:yes stop_codon:yes gene_type:complete